MLLILSCLAGVKDSTSQQPDGTTGPNFALILQVVAAAAAVVAVFIAAYLWGYSEGKKETYC